MTAGRLLPASVAGQQTQIFHISTGTRRNNNCGYLSFANTFPRITVRRGESSTVPHNLLGCVYEQGKLPAEAEAQYREAIRLDSKFAPAHGNLGNLLLREHKLEPAKKELELAIKLDPTGFIL
ncbi:MAG: hypothetical protein DMG38_28235 [Acidobacteria bacterium]|nr:MAG: hypothetical protein DMG38_28235 [Acidobacteriota bacterium]